MTDPVAMICPETGAPESTLKVILSFFGSVKIGRPWFMDQPAPLLQSGVIELLRPPEHLKPSGDFKALLAEYRRWIRTSRDKGFDAFLAFQEQKSHGEEATWEIRGELRRREGRLHEDQGRNALKWNLFLHLAHEIEEEEREAEELLSRLKKMDSPLKGVIEEEAPLGPLSDLPEREHPVALSETGRAQVLEAWFCLFEERLREEAVLFSLSPANFQHLCDTWEEWGGGPASTEMEFSVPDFSRLDLQEVLEARGRFMNSREGAALKEGVRRFLQGRSEASGENTDAVDLRGLTERKTTIRLRRFPLLERPSTKEIVRHLSGKTVGFIRERHTYGE
jgi:hypothetical protein